MEREETGIQLLLSQPEIVAWLGQTEPERFSDESLPVDTCAGDSAGGES